MQLGALIRSLNAQCGGADAYAANCPGQGISENDAARNSIDTPKVWDVVTTANTDSVFLLDLSLTQPLFRSDQGVSVPLNEALAKKYLEQKINERKESWAAAAKQLIDSAKNSYKDLLGKYSTAILACAVLKARKIPCIIVSGVVGYADFGPWTKDWNLPTAQSSDEKSWQDWEKEIVKLHRHPDMITGRILNLYASPIANDDKAWEHDWCGNNISQGEGIWGSSLGDTANKVLHCRADNSWRFRKDVPEPIEKSVFLSVVEKLGFEFTVICEIDRVVLPKGPGIVFLLSLRELVNEIHTPGNRKAKGMVFGKDHDLHYVSLVFEGFSQLAAIKRLLSKDWKAHLTLSGNDSGKDPIREQIPAGGVSEAIFHLCHSRLGGIKGDDDWVELFRNGSAKWGMWPCITGDGITFYW